MCGICGIVDFRTSGEDYPQRLPRMVHSLHHRGPDESGTHYEPNVALGHSRLSIIDLSDGRQPLSNEDGTIWITYNGEVYNFPQLRRELIDKGHIFRTRTDTEVLVHLYEQEGMAGVGRLRGMFAFALWDARKRTAYLARDPVGIKPLHYMLLNGRLIFGSEIKAILAHGGVPRDVDVEALSDYLTYLYVPAPKTMFRGIYKLEPGHWLQFDHRGLIRRQYWDLQPPIPLRAKEKDIERQLVDRLAESVSGQLVSDVPLGAFLSGGVDSSSVVAMMRHVGQDPLITASVGFQEERYNELPHARRVADRFSTHHHEQIVKPEAASIVDKLVWHYDEPFADHSAIPTYYVSQAARQHVTVALSGDGGDENFAGYSRHRWAVSEQRLRRMIPFPIRKMLFPLAGACRASIARPRLHGAMQTLRNIATDPVAAYLHTMGTMADHCKSELITPEFDSQLGGYDAAEVIRGYMNKAGRNGLNKFLYVDVKTFLVDDILTKVDRASMAVSLEVRVPFLDHTFMEFAHAVPESLKIQGREGKAVFKSAMRTLLDAETLYRPKQGFNPPVGEWMRGPLRDMVQAMLFTGQPFFAAYLRPAALAARWNEHLSGRHNHGMLLWAVLMFELWARKFLAGDQA